MICIYTLNMIQIFKNYFIYQGRVSRSEFLKSFFTYLIFSTILFIFIINILPVSVVNIIDKYSVTILYCLVSINGVTYRRFHDLNKSGFLMFLMPFGSFAPIFGLAVLISIIMGAFQTFSSFLLIIGSLSFIGIGLTFLVVFLNGTDGPNQYGPDPLAPKDNPQLSV
jgi:uncharacterized membrane protein YhaH (DUF805 family)